MLDDINLLKALTFFRYTKLNRNLSILRGEEGKEEE